MFERRTLLKLGLAATAGVGLGAPALAWADAPSSTDPRCVSFDNLHTGEQLEAVYWEDGNYIPDVLDAVNHHLRDFRTGDVFPIDPGLLDLVDAVNTLTGTKARFEVISGYRSAATNALLRERSEEVAKKSFHMSGMAIDVRLPDIDLARLHDAVRSLGRGGVGYYPYSNFVHMDVGPVRAWQGA